MEMERGIRRPYPPAMGEARLRSRLFTRALHFGRRFVKSSARSIRETIREEIDLPRQVHHQLGPCNENGDLRYRSDLQRRTRRVLPYALSAGGWFRAYRNRDDTARDDARRYGGRGSPERRALSAFDRQE